MGVSGLNISHCDHFFNFIHLPSQTAICLNLISNIEFVTGPLILFRCLHHFCPDRVEMNIAGQFFGVFILFNQNRLIAALKQMTVSRPLDIEVSRVGAVDMVHDLGNIAGRRFEQQVIMLCEVRNYVELPG